MFRYLIRLFMPLFFCLPTFASAADTLIHAAWSQYVPPSGYTVAGYNLYQEGTLACQVQNPTATSMDCAVTLAADTTYFTLTASFSNGTQSPHSAAFAFTISGGSNDGTSADGSAILTATFSTAPLSGQAPLAVSFNGTASTGTITSYHWEFGDGATGAGSTAIHTYAKAGTYTAKLTVTNALGQISTATGQVTATTEPAESSSTPIAVISSSAAVGQGPLQVSFDGSGSTAASGATITSYAWSFGDGVSATGTTTTHTYTTAGTFTALLTVTDSNGLSDTTATPIVVTASSTANTPPTAVVGATPINGTVPLTVTFNGSASSDLDGNIASYAWNFGDGKTASGAAVTHTYTSAASFIAVLTVTDDQGAKGSATVTITVHAEEEAAAPLNIELGEISVGSEWVRVTFEDTFTNPVVIAGPPSFNNAEPCVVRLRNVNNTGFDIRLTEWDYLDGGHPQEIVSYLVMEKGRHTLSDGSTVEAGIFTGTTSFRTVPFSATFATTPVVITTIASFNTARAISGRLRTISTTNFAYYFREQERNKNTHADETVHYIAWEPGQGTIGTLQFEVATTGNEVTDAWHSAKFQEPFQDPPLLLADMQTTNDTDTAALRVRQNTATGFQVKVEEEQSRDDEIIHPQETIGYLVFGARESDSPPAMEPLTTTIHAQWTSYTAPSGYTVTGFNLYQEENLVCQTQDRTATSIDCAVTLTAVTTHFTLTSSFSNGSESPHSEPFAFTVSN